MIHVYTKDNEFHVLKDAGALKDLIVEWMGEYVGIEVQELIDDADYNTSRVESDLISYEGSLESLTSSFQETLEAIDNLMDYIRVSKRLDRDLMLDKLKAVEKIILNEI